jgi:hypothetical protein
VRAVVLQQQDGEIVVEHGSHYQQLRRAGQ